MISLRVLFLIILSTLLKMDFTYAHIPYRHHHHHRKALAIQEEEEEEEEGVGDLTGFVAELIHRDARSSHLRSISKQRLPQERLKLAVQRSYQRLRSISATLSSKYGSSQEAEAETPHNNSAPDGFMSAGKNLRRLDAAPDDGGMISSSVSEVPGEYLMLMILGTPGQPVEAVIDTGSYITWVQCAGCVACYKQQGFPFDPRNSSTYKAFNCADRECSSPQVQIKSCTPNCQYFQEYGNGSWLSEGVYSSETITVTSANGNSHTISNFTFGCASINIGSFPNGGGIVGLGPVAINSFTAQLIKTLSQNKFAYCFVGFHDAMEVTSHIYFGAATDRLHIAGMISIPFLTSVLPHYVVALNGISVGGKQVTGAIPGSVFFDSGSMLTYLELSAYTAVKTEFMNSIPHPPISNPHQIAGAGHDLCYYVTGKTTFLVPHLTLHFTGADLTPPANNYFIKVGSVLCLFIAPIWDPSISVIGNMMQQNYWVEYNLNLSMLSLAPANCSSVNT